MSSRASRLAIERSSGTRVVVDGRELVMFAGCDYLGLSHDPRVAAALAGGVRELGLSASASRTTTGNARAHDDLERDLARFLGLAAAVIVPTGYLAGLFVAQALRSEVATALVDEHAHVSTRDALSSAGIASVDCDAHAARAAIERARGGRIALFTDGAYPVLQRIAPLGELLAALPRDAWLVVDDCHATGVLGARGRGTHEHHGVADARLVVTGTLSKALGGFGGFVAGGREIVERVTQRSRAHAGSTPIPPAIARAASEAIRIVEAEPELLARLRARTATLRTALRAAGLRVHDLPLPVFAWKLGSSADVERVARGLDERGFLVPHVSYPDGLGGYFRCAVSAAHDPRDVERLATALAEIGVA